MNRSIIFMLKIWDVAPNAVLNISFIPPACYDVPLSITDFTLTVNTQTNRASPDQLIEKFVSLLSFNDSQITELEKATRNQSIIMKYNLQNNKFTFK